MNAITVHGVFLFDDGIAVSFDVCGDAGAFSAKVARPNIANGWHFVSGSLFHWNGSFHLDPTWVFPAPNGSGPRTVVWVNSLGGKIAGIPTCLPEGNYSGSLLSLSSDNISFVPDTIADAFPTSGSTSHMVAPAVQAPTDPITPAAPTEHQHLKSPEKIQPETTSTLVTSFVDDGQMDAPYTSEPMAAMPYVNPDVDNGRVFLSDKAALARKVPLNPPNGHSSSQQSPLDSQNDQETQETQETTETSDTTDTQASTSQMPPVDTSRIPTKRPRGNKGARNGSRATKPVQNSHETTETRSSSENGDHLSQLDLSDLGGMIS